MIGLLDTTPQCAYHITQFVFLREGGSKGFLFRILEAGYYYILKGARAWSLGVLPVYTRLGNLAQFYLGDAEHYLEKIANELGKLPPPEKPKGKPLRL